MNDRELAVKVNLSMYHQCRDRGVATPVDVRMDIGVLQKDKYEDWRFGRVSYLERVCTINLHKLSTVRHQIRVYAQKAGLKPSFCYYKRWGPKRKAARAANLCFPCVSVRVVIQKSKNGTQPILLIQSGSQNSKQQS